MQRNIAEGCILIAKAVRPSKIPASN